MSAVDTWLGFSREERDLVHKTLASISVKAMNDCHVFASETPEWNDLIMRSSVFRAALELLYEVTNNQ